jgi:DNA polymerase III psi subunit
MLDEGSLARLAEMGIDVYLPRVRGEQPRAQVPETVSAPALPAVAAEVVATVRSGVVLVAPATAPKPAGLLADVARALRFARLDCTACEAPDEAALQEARAFVLFGEAQVRSLGARLPAQRQREVGWVVTGDAIALAGDAQAKRALWSELRRLVRTLR